MESNQDPHDEEGTIRQVTINGDPYNLFGKLASGEFCDVYYGSRQFPYEGVVVKLAREGTENSLEQLRGETHMIHILRDSGSRGSDVFARLLPEVVVSASKGNVQSDDGFVGHANVFRWRPGFLYTFEDVMKAFPDGVDPRSAVWMWKRTLAFLGWMHQQGYVHGSVTPQHVLIHPRDHGAVFVGMSRVTKSGSPLPALSREYEQYYPKDVWEGDAASPMTDLTMLARCMIHLLSGTKKSLPEGMPESLKDILLTYNDGGCMKNMHSTWDLLQLVDAKAQEAYGKSRYVDFRMPEQA